MYYSEENSTTNKYYYFGDNLGSTVALVDSSGDVVERYSYDVWGEPTIYDGSGNEITESDVANPFMFTAREVDFLDEDTSTGSYRLKFQHNRHRVYDYLRACWLQSDPRGVVPNDYMNPFKPIGQYKDGVNIYEYVGSDPLYSIDSFGLKQKRIEPIGRKIEWILLKRIIRMPLGLNFILSDDYTIYDELEEMMEYRSIIRNINRLYRSQIVGDSGSAFFNIGSAPGKWVIDVDSDKYYDVDGSLGTAWWLHGAHNVSAEGSFDYCCDRNFCMLTNIKAKFKWHDDIDANSFIEGMDNGSHWLIYIIEGAYDIAIDKMNEVDFWVDVVWTENRQEPLKIRK